MLLRRRRQRDLIRGTRHWSLGLKPAEIGHRVTQWDNFSQNAKKFAEISPKFRRSFGKFSAKFRQSFG